MGLDHCVFSRNISDDGEQTIALGQWMMRSGGDVANTRRRLGHNLPD
ncbi:MAG: hypothetical protein JRJ77_17625 [Deltaproteobacteria bacterium]|nr:hypothetical protein [Deltaproteobacteria bacterium]MBW2340470.1 hypothetical protein [Deltaproteobacteria bacterium]